MLLYFEKISKYSKKFAKLWKSKFWKSKQNSVSQSQIESSIFEHVYGVFWTSGKIKATCDQTSSH